MQGVVVHAFNPRTQEGRGRQISEFKANLVYKVSFRTARAVRETLSQKTKKKKKTQQKKKRKKII